MVAKKPRIVIVGAGMAGLTAANRLHTAAGGLVEVTVLEAGGRIGGRILTSEFAGDRVEMGATWIHGIGGSPVHALADKIGALVSGDTYERMDGFPEDFLTVAEGGTAGGGGVISAAFVDSVYSFYRGLMDAARDGEVAVDPESRGVGSYLRKALAKHRAELVAGGGDDRSLDAVFEMNENTERTFTSADDLDDLDLAAESEYRVFPGEEITIAKGYSRVIEALAAALPKDSVKLNARARRVDWRAGDGVVRVHVDGEDDPIAADHVIVTVSLGVLKASLGKEAPLEFSPPLPARKREAIGRLGFGVVDKLFLEMDGGDFPNLQMAFEGEEKKVGIPRWMRRTASICPIYGGSRVALAWLAGDEAAEMEAVSDEEVVGGVRATLEGFGLGGSGGKYGRVVGVKRSAWGRDPLFRGSYSYVSVGASGEDMDAMAEPLPAGEGSPAAAPMRMMFAGEATHRTHYSTTHGAYLSGMREANRLLHHYRAGGGCQQ